MPGGRSSTFPQKSNFFGRHPRFIEQIRVICVRGLSRLPDYPPGEREDLIRWSLWSHNRQGFSQAVVSHETALAVHELS